MSQTFKTQPQDCVEISFHRRGSGERNNDAIALCWDLGYEGEALDLGLGLEDVGFEVEVQGRLSTVQSE